MATRSLGPTALAQTGLGTHGAYAGGGDEGKKKTINPRGTRPASRPLRPAAKDSSFDERGIIPTKRVGESKRRDGWRFGIGGGLGQGSSAGMDNQASTQTHLHHHVEDHLSAQGTLSDKAARGGKDDKAITAEHPGTDIKSVHKSESSVKEFGGKVYRVWESTGTPTGGA